MTSPVFYCDTAALENIGVADTLVLDGNEGHHAKNVRRLKVGEPVDVSDGQGRRIRGEVTALLSQGLEVTVREFFTEIADPAVYLVQALAKSDRDLLGIESATELGVTGIIPWAAEHCVVRWKQDRIAKFHSKWNKTVVAAAKQARRAWIPPVADIHTSAQLADYMYRQGSNSVIFVLHESADTRLTRAFSEYLRERGQPQKIFVVVGPEGGISEHELRLFTSAGALPVRLGQEVLRSSTAGSAALSAIHTLGGSW